MNANNIDLWAESISSLNDRDFSSLIHLYIGEFKTPYNKQKLISQLASFIKTPENLNGIVTLLSEDDLRILNSIHFMPSLTQTDLITFLLEFSDAPDEIKLFAKIKNLKERLLIFTAKDSYSGKEYLHINPLILETLEPYFNIKILFPDPQIAMRSTDDIFMISPNFLAAFISYLKIHGCACRSDGVIKKNDLNRLQEIFPGKIECIQLLLTAFINLGLVFEGPKKLEMNNARIQAFSKLPQQHQYAFLCAASVSRLSRDGLRKQAQLLLDCIACIGEQGFTQDSLLRLAFMLGTFTKEGSSEAKKSRFSMILEAAHSESVTDSVQNAQFLDRMLASAAEFGLIKSIGKTEDNMDIFVPGEIIPEIVSSEPPKILSLDSTFTVTLMPGLLLFELIPLTSFMIVKKCGIATELEITKQSVSASFDCGWTPDQIFETLQKYSNYQIPQNLKININEWFSTYNAAIIYKGFVLKVNEQNKSLIENNPNVKRYIKEKLAEGVYLLNIPVQFDSSEISSFIKQSGLEFLGQIKTFDSPSEMTGFPLLRDGKKIAALEQACAGGMNVAAQSIDKDKTAVFLAELKSSLEKLGFEADKKAVLMNRIKNRLIISKNQLNSTSLRLEILEASGTDFSGKYNLIESAINEGDILEITLPDSENSGQEKFITITGIPNWISSRSNDAVITLEISATKEQKTILISQITHLKRLKF